jgi:flagellin-like hook-associated protein FlgL
VTVDRRETLADLRRRLSSALDDTDNPRDLAALSKELRAIVAELDSIPGGEEVDTVDDLAARRAARLADAAGQ